MSSGLKFAGFVNKRAGIKINFPRSCNWPDGIPAKDHFPDWKMGSGAFLTWSFLCCSMSWMPNLKICFQEI